MNKLPNLPINHPTACPSTSQAGIKPYTYVPVLGIFTTVKSSLQIDLFMQNKPNFLKSQMNVTYFITKDYERNGIFAVPQNKANSNPNKPNFKSEGRSEKWNFSHRSSDLYYRTMQKSRAQIYNELLVLKCQQGSKDAFDELVERWQKRLWHYAFQLTGSDAAAWDIVQEAWVGIINGIRKLGDTAVFPRWAFRILNNKCADWLRKQHLQSRLSDQLANQTQDESDEKQNGSEKAESLQAAVEKLSPQRRALLALRYREGFDISQIAEILCIPEGTVKSRLHRTLERLRQVMGQK
jgi:RNA polymerase sigma-70 factor (ECF subfamily)